VPVVVVTTATAMATTATVAPLHRLRARAGAAPPGRPTTPGLAPSTCGRARPGCSTLYLLHRRWGPVHASSSTPVSSSSSATSAAVQDAVVRGVGSKVPRRLLQHHGAHSPMPVTDWGPTLMPPTTSPYTQVAFPLPAPLRLSIPAIIVGNDSILLVTSIGNTMFPEPFYLNDVLVAPDLVQSLLSISRFTTDNSCFMEFDPLGLSVKDLATQSVIERYNSSGTLYTIPLPASATSITNAPPYALAAAASISTWHRRLGHPGHPAWSSRT
jgi:hypothetical protein